MPGTILLATAAVHTYQRRFSTAELAWALGSANLYVVSRRPRTTIHREDPSDRDLTVIISGDDGVEHWGVLPLPPEITELSVDPSGQYFKFQLADRSAHGEAWALATLLTDGQPMYSRHQVLYVGRSQDVEGRIARHSTLQRIYEQHAHAQWDVFVTPLMIQESVLVGDDHVAAPSQGSDEAFWELQRTFSTRAGGRTAKAAINLAEHATIAYFQPEYNQKLKTWSGLRKTDEMELMWRAGFRLASVQVQGAFELARFDAPNGASPRSHTILCEVPDDPRERGFGAVPPELAPQTSEYDGYQIILNGTRASQRLYEESPYRLNVFGDPPAIATPPDVRSWLDNA